MRSNSPNDVAEWGSSYGDDVIILDDPTGEAWGQYTAGLGKPEFVVIDRDMTIVYKGGAQSGSVASEAEVLQLLAQ